MEMEIEIIERTVDLLGRGMAITWFTGFVLLGVASLGGALVPLWVRSHRQRKTAEVRHKYVVHHDAFDERTWGRHG